MARHISVKPIIFFIINIITGVPSVMLLLAALGGAGDGSVSDYIFKFFPYIIGADFVYFLVLFFGMPYIDTPASNYDTTTTTYTMNSSGEVDVSVSTPEDKAEVATIWKRIGMSVLCTVGMGISHLVLVFVIPFTRMRGKGRAIALVFGIILFAAAAVFPFAYPKIKKAVEDNAYGPKEILYEHTDDGFVVTGCEEGTTVINIPAKHNREPVVGIKESAFESNIELTSVTIPKSVKDIGYSAFCGCRSLTSIDIPAGVTSIGEKCFYDCSSLTSISIGGVAKIGKEAFVGTAYYNNEDNWKDDALYIDKYLIKVKPSKSGEFTVEDGTRVIARNAVRSAKLTSVKLPNSVTEVGEYAFCDCNELTSIELSNSITYMGEYSFGYCKKLTSLEIPSGIKCIGKKAFINCELLETLTIGSGVTTIEEEAFIGCTRLKSISIPNSVTSIGGDAFVSSHYLENVVIPRSVTFIGKVAFKGSTMFWENMTLYCEAESKPEEWDKDWCASCTVVWGYKNADKK